MYHNGKEAYIAISWESTQEKNRGENRRDKPIIYKYPNGQHPTDDIDRQYVSRKEGQRGLASIEDSVDT